MSLDALEQGYSEWKAMLDDKIAQLNQKMLVDEMKKETSMHRLLSMIDVEKEKDGLYILRDTKPCTRFIVHIMLGVSGLMEDQWRMKIRTTLHIRAVQEMCVSC